MFVDKNSSGPEPLPAGQDPSNVMTETAARPSTNFVHHQEQQQQQRKPAAAGFLDLFGDAPAAPVATSAPSTTAGSSGGWDGFGKTVVQQTAVTTGGDWEDFSSASPAPAATVTSAPQPQANRTTEAVVPSSVNDMFAGLDVPAPEAAPAPPKVETTKEDIMGLFDAPPPPQAVPPQQQNMGMTGSGFQPQQQQQQQMLGSMAPQNNGVMNMPPQQNQNFMGMGGGVLQIPQMPQANGMNNVNGMNGMNGMMQQQRQRQRQQQMMGAGGMGVGAGGGFVQQVQRQMSNNMYSAGGLGGMGAGGMLTMPQIPGQQQVFNHHQQQQMPNSFGGGMMPQQRNTMTMPQQMYVNQSPQNLNPNTPAPIPLDTFGGGGLAGPDSYLAQAEPEPKKLELFPDLKW